MRKITISGTGIYAPGTPINNAELSKIAQIDFDANKLEEKLGIHNRHIAKFRNLSETTADFAEKAALEAIKNANISGNDVDLIIVATDTPEFITPATSILVQGRIQKEERPIRAFDLAASCASFTSAFDTAARLMKSDKTIKNALVIGVYNMPAFIRDKDVFGYTIFADGAGAFVLSESKTESDYIDNYALTDGTQWNFVGIYAGGAKHQINKEILDSEKYGLENLQRLPPDRNIKLWPEVVNQLLEKNYLSANDIDHYIFTQINKSVIVEVMNILNQPMEKTTLIMNQFGYTGSGCVPMAFHNAIKENKIKKGNKIMFVASGAGFEVAANLFEY